MQLPISFNNAVVAQLALPEDTVITRELMGADEVQVAVTLSGTLQCPIGAYIILNGWRYSINTIPSPMVTGDENGLRYTYKLTFESPVYSLYNKGLRYLNNKTFQVTGDLSEMAYLVVANINEIEPGWSVGVVDDLGIKAVDFDKHSCRTALNKIAEVFSCEWYASGVDGRTINFVKQAGNLTNLVFEYGMGKGLYSLGFDYQSDKNIVTRAYGYGAGKNLPAGYRNGATELMFDGYYLEKNTNLYRIREGDYIDEDIYPTVQGVVTATSPYDKDSPTFTITDTALAFDLNSYFSPDTPKVVFQSGQLMGQVFDISTYEHATRTIKLNKVNDAAGNLLPGAVVAVEVGDKYTLIDMYMPDEVVEAAEQKLRDKTQSYLDENCVPRVLYSLELDPLYARDNGIRLTPGDQIRVRHQALGIDALIRVTSVNYPVNFPTYITPSTKITATIANFVPYTVQERVIAATIDTAKDIRTVNRVNAERARQNAANMKKLQGLIFNPDGSLFTGVNSLVAGMAHYGYDSQNFNLNGVNIKTNLGADPNTFAISSGKLVHYIYKVDGLGYIWQISTNQWSGLNPAKPYYVYAKCSSYSLVGTWEISENQVGVSDFPGFYVFNLGVLYDVNSAGYRDFDFTKGATDIVGGRIKTGEIVSQDGETYFNLDSGEIGGKIVFKAGSSGYQNLTDKPDLSGFDSTQATIDGGLVTAGDILLGSGNTINSGITGRGVAADSVRFFAGSTFADRKTAPFQVLQDGTVIATRAVIYGDVTADSGEIGNYKIDQQGLRNVEDKDAYIVQQRTPPGAPVIPGRGAIEASIGTNISNNGAVGIFRNLVGNPLGGGSYGVDIKVAGGTNTTSDRPELTGNYALSVEGDITQKLGTALFEGVVSIRGGVKVDGVDGWTGAFDVRSSASPSGFITLNYKKGFFTGFTF